MSIHAILPGIGSETAPGTLRLQSRAGKRWQVSPSLYLANNLAEDETARRHAELFYLQKQIHTQTPMVIVLLDGEHIEGCIEWYDRYALKVRGRSKTLVYKSAIKYMYKVGDSGQ